MGNRYNGYPTKNAAAPYDAGFTGMVHPFHHYMTHPAYQTHIMSHFPQAGVHPQTTVFTQHYQQIPESNNPVTDSYNHLQRIQNVTNQRANYHAVNGRQQPQQTSTRLVQKNEREEYQMGKPDSDQGGSQFDNTKYPVPGFFMIIRRGEFPFVEL